MLPRIAVPFIVLFFAFGLSACGDTWRGAKKDTGENLKATGEALENAGEKIKN